MSQKEELMRFTRTLGICILTLLLNSSFTHANPRLFARIILTETPEGVSILKRIVGPAHVTGTAAKDYDTFLQRLKSPEMASVRKELEQRLADASDLLDDYRALKQKPGTSGKFTDEEILMMKQIASRELLINPAWRGGMGLLKERPFQFARPKLPRSTYDELGERFLSEAPAVAPVATAPQQKQAHSWVMRNVTGMRDCLKNMPAAQRRSANTLHVLRQLGITETITLTGYVLGAGSKKVDWKNLPTDLIVAGTSSLVGSLVMSKDGTFWVKYIRMLVFGEGRSVYDAIFYYITPVKDTHGLSAEEAMLDRLEFNMAWNIGSPLISISSFTLVRGLECLYPTATMKLVGTGLTMASSLGSSSMYFRMRKAYQENYSDATYEE